MTKKKTASFRGKPSPEAAKAPKLAAIRKMALALPGAFEVPDHVWPWFNVGKKTFALYHADSARWIFKLPMAQQMMLFDARPQTFSPMRAGKLLWSYVKVQDLDAEELRDLLTAAWRVVAPKKLQANV
ncbi:MAG: MmcQ/YjbR family DNA-binding protein [Alphaproteobacteria bacterium]|nr:MmcQ/YjbR family DNA-binding protein [Alphaproteobacteria bacterium]